MNDINYQKHSRSRALAVHTDFKLHKKDEELIRKLSEEDSTQVTRSNQSPTDPQCHQVFTEIMESIENRFKLMKICKEDKIRAIKSKVLSLFMKSSREEIGKRPSKEKIVNEEISMKKKVKKKKSVKKLVLRSSKTSKDLKVLDFPLKSHRSAKSKSIKLSSID